MVVLERLWGTGYFSAEARLRYADLFVAHPLNGCGHKNCCGIDKAASAHSSNSGQQALNILFAGQSMVAVTDHCHHHGIER